MTAPCSNMPPSARAACANVVAHLEGRVVRQERAGEHDGRSGALPLHHHAARCAHHVVRVLVQDAPAAFCDLRHVGVQIHLGEQDERGGIVGIDRPTALGDQSGIAVARGLLALAPAGAPGKRQRKAFPREEIDPFDRLDEGPRIPLGVVQLLRIVIQAHAKEQTVAIRLAQPRQAVADARPQHRLHGVGQEQNLEPARERVAQHLDDVRIHERLAAGEADLTHRQAPTLDLIEKGDCLGAGDIV